MEKVGKLCIVLFVLSLTVSCSVRRDLVLSVDTISTLFATDAKGASSVIMTDDDEMNTLSYKKISEVIKTAGSDGIDEEIPKAIPKEEEIIFSSEPINEATAERMAGRTFFPGKEISLEELRYVLVGYYGFDGDYHQGELIVNKVIADDVIAIFRELYDNKFPIAKMVLASDYESDSHSMKDNNTSGFNYRKIDGTDRLSKHAFGLAVDINPLVNPHVTSSCIHPEEGSRYVNRGLNIPGMVKKYDLCYRLFTSRGFEWGGDWETSKDYQHFEFAGN